MKTILFTLLALCFAQNGSTQWLEGGRKQEAAVNGNGAILYHEGKLYTFNETMFMSRSDDNGATWIDLPDSGLPPKGPGIAKGISRLTAAGGRIYGGMNFGNGTGMPVYSTDQGETWHQDTLGAPGHALGWDGLPAVNDIFAWGHWLYIKWDAPNAFDIKEFGGPYVRNTYMATNGNQPNGRCAKGDTLFTSSVKFKYTIDGGVNWVTPANNGIVHDNYFTGGPLFADGNRIFMIAKEKWNGPFSIYYTDDNGENWMTIDVPAISSKKDLAGSYYFPMSYFFRGNNIWMGFTFDSFNKPPNIYHSSDLGVTWAADTLGLPSSYVNGVVGFAYTSDGMIWCSPSYQEIYKKKINAGTGGGNTVTMAPVLILPPDMQQIANPDATIVWSKVANATTYHLQVATDTAFTMLITDDATLTDTSKTIDSLTANTTYYWRVRGTNSEGQGPWAAMRSFMTMASGVASEGVTSIRISPNPASEYLTIEFGTAEVSSVHIYDILGKKVMHSFIAQGSNTLKLQVTTLPTGSYTVHIISKNKATVSRKLFIQ